MSRAGKESIGGSYWAMAGTSNAPVFKFTVGSNPVKVSSVSTYLGSNIYPGYYCYVEANFWTSNGTSFGYGGSYPVVGSSKAYVHGGEDPEWKTMTMANPTLNANTTYYVGFVYDYRYSEYNIHVYYDENFSNDWGYFTDALPIFWSTQGIDQPPQIAEPIPTNNPEYEWSMYFDYEAGVNIGSNGPTGGGVNVHRNTMYFNKFGPFPYNAEIKYIDVVTDDRWNANGKGRCWLFTEGGTLIARTQETGAGGASGGGSSGGWTTFGFTSNPVVTSGTSYYISYSQSNLAGPYWETGYVFASASDTYIENAACGILNETNIYYLNGNFDPDDISVDGTPRTMRCFIEEQGVYNGPDIKMEGLRLSNQISYLEGISNLQVEKVEGIYTI